MAGGKTLNVKPKTYRRPDGKERGQGMVEFALLLPLFLVVLFLVIDFGVGISRWVIVTNSTREGARVGAVGATPADIANKVATTSNGLLAPVDVSVNYVDGPDSNTALGDRGDSVVVESDYEYGLITPLSAFLGLLFDSISFHSCTDMRLELQVSGASNPDGVLGC